MAHCPDLEILGKYGRGELPVDQFVDVDHHVEGCERCRIRLPLGPEISTSRDLQVLELDSRNQELLQELETFLNTEPVGSTKCSWVTAATGGATGGGFPDVVLTPSEVSQPPREEVLPKKRPGHHPTKLRLMDFIGKRRTSNLIARVFGDDASCLDTETLVLVADGWWPERGSSLVQAHLDKCAHCRGDLAALDRSRTQLRWAARKRLALWIALWIAIAAAAALIVGSPQFLGSRQTHPSEGLSPSETLSPVLVVQRQGNFAGGLWGPRST